MTDDLDLPEIIHRTIERLVEDGTIDPAEPSAERVADVVTAKLREAGRATADSLRRGTPAMLNEQHVIRDGFERRLRDIWGPGLDALEAVMVAAYEAGEQVFSKERRVGADDPQLEALLRLHARACLVTSEILNLLRTGHASGALARWRTLHELAVVALFIKDHDRETAERYLVHADVLRASRLDPYQKHAERLGDVRLTPAEEQAVRDRRAEILRGVDDPAGFKSPWGWAGPTLGIRKPNFPNVLEAVDLDHWRPWVDLANYPIHAGSAGLTFDLGNDAPMLLAGPSNAGLGAPGHNAAISLQLATVALLMHRLKAKWSVYLLTISNLVDDVGAAFARCEAEYDRRKASLASGG